MLRKTYLAFVALLGLTSLGCQTPYGGGCAGGCCGGSCGASHSTYAPSPTYAPSTTYAPANNQQAMPPAFNGGGSGSR